MSRKTMQEHDSGPTLAHSLPFEVQRLIIRASDTPTLLELARVSRAYLHEVIPVLYRHVRINNEDDGAGGSPGSSSSPSSPSSPPPAAPFRTLTHILTSPVHLRHIQTFFCARSHLLQGQRARRHCIELWDALLSPACPKLQCAAWVRAADDYYVGLAAEMVRVVDAPDPTFACSCRRGTQFEWHLYGDLHHDMVSRLTSARMDLVSVYLTVTPGTTQASVDKIELILPSLLDAAPHLRFVQIQVGYNMLEIGSRARRMDRARAFRGLTTRLQQLKARFPERDLEIVSSPSTHVFSTSIDVVDCQLPGMLKIDFEKALLKPRAPDPSTAPHTRH
ncbi:hypothetical protein OC842_005579 [Tilletia horrida]|uniref:Uncharacterized protein n=1 Tax=Tilletia horrida TaxID=155126 RepID=A0AAN6G8W7_9BASI|nr:hypothetical protein OC842_005579 [Tilletia horrida]